MKQKPVITSWRADPEVYEIVYNLAKEKDWSISKTLSYLAKQYKEQTSCQVTGTKQ